eukprot:TRINITY_DN3160_c0_g1_i7.p1 TRINITY_DN3160_c0_g1~~TRINITY_DN3160_c0_g1_i7.p1  ORF type:complete len:140 (+),score=20.63 TRINITY_DN3160_c0_g1_i7:420-839(+)
MDVPSFSSYFNTNSYPPSTSVQYSKPKVSLLPFIVYRFYEFVELLSQLFNNEYFQRQTGYREYNLFLHWLQLLKSQIYLDCAYVELLSVAVALFKWVSGQFYIGIPLVHLLFIIKRFETSDEHKQVSSHITNFLRSWST